MIRFVPSARFRDPSVPVPALDPREIAAFATFLLKGDYRNEIRKLFAVAADYADWEGLKRGWVGHEDRLLAKIKDLRQTNKIRTFVERYTGAENVGLKPRQREVLERAVRSDPIRFATLDRLVHHLNTSNNLQEIRISYVKLVALTGRTQALFPRPAKVNYKSRNLKNPAP